MRHTHGLGILYPSRYHGLCPSATPNRWSKPKSLPKHLLLNPFCSSSPVNSLWPCSAPEQMAPPEEAAELVLHQDPAAFIAPVAWSASSASQNLDAPSAPVPTHPGMEQAPSLGALLGAAPAESSRENFRGSSGENRGSHGLIHPLAPGQEMSFSIEEL